MKEQIECSSCKLKITDNEIYYVLSIHTEYRDSLTHAVRLLEAVPIDVKCQICADKEVHVC
jgi:hypothetical protein